MSWYVRTRLNPGPSLRLEVVTNLVDYITIVEVINPEEMKLTCLYFLPLKCERRCFD